jgi:hypothetical protein
LLFGKTPMKDVIREKNEKPRKDAKTIRHPSLHSVAAPTPTPPSTDPPVSIEQVPGYLLRSQSDLQSGVRRTVIDDPPHVTAQGFDAIMGHPRRHRMYVPVDL